MTDVPSASVWMVPFMVIDRVESAGLMRLRTAKPGLPTKLAVVPEFWKLIVPPPIAVSVGIQSITVCPGLTLIVVRLGDVPIEAPAPPLVVKLPLPSRLCAIAGVAPTTSTVASARTEQLVRDRRDGSGKLRIRGSRAAGGWSASAGSGDYRGDCRSRFARAEPRPRRRSQAARRARREGRRRRT